MTSPFHFHYRPCPTHHVLILSLFFLVTLTHAQLAPCTISSECTRPGETCNTVASATSLRPCDDALFCFCSPLNPADLVFCDNVAECPGPNQKCGAPTGLNRAKICVGCDSIPVDVTLSNLGNCAPLPSESPSPVAVTVTPTPEVETMIMPSVDPTVTPMPVTSMPMPVTSMPMPMPTPMEMPMMTAPVVEGDGEDLVVPPPPSGDVDATQTMTMTATPTMTVMEMEEGPMPSMPVDMPPMMALPSPGDDTTTDKDVDLSGMMMPSMDVMMSPHDSAMMPDDDGDMTMMISPMPMSSDMATADGSGDDTNGDTTTGEGESEGEDSTPEPSGEPICVDATLLAHLSADELVFPSHRRASVLCDTRGSCATAGHMVHFQGRAMMMRSYCALVKAEGGCSRTVKMVNSPKFKRGVRVRSKTDGLSFTSFAARYESKMEEHVLKTLIHIGL